MTHNLESDYTYVIKLGLEGKAISSTAKVLVYTKSFRWEPPKLWGFHVLP